MDQLFPKWPTSCKDLFVKNKKHGAYEEFNKFGKRTAIGGRINPDEVRKILISTNTNLLVDR